MVDQGTHYGVYHYAYKEIKGHVDGVYECFFIGIQLLYGGQHDGGGGKEKEAQRQQYREDPETFQIQKKEGEQRGNHTDNQKGPGSAQFITEGSCKQGPGSTCQLKHSQRQIREMKGMALRGEKGWQVVGQ